MSEGCLQNDLTSLECAKSMYQHVLQAADEYIKAYANKPGTDNCILMMVDKHNIMVSVDNFVISMKFNVLREFGDQPIS